MANKNSKYYQEWSEERRELEHQSKIQAEYKETKRVNKLSNIQVTRDIFTGKIKSTQLFYKSNNIDAWAQIIQTYRNLLKQPKKLKEYEDVCMAVVKKSNKFFEDMENIRALQSIAYYKDNFIKDISTWKPRAKRTLLHELLRHLFVKYETPSFLNKGFINFNIEAIELFIHIGNGKPLKSFALAPELILTKKASQYLISTPSDFDYFESFRRAQVLSIGGSEVIANAMLASKLGDRRLVEKEEKFWYTVIEFFVNVGMFDVRKVSEIVDFIYTKKYERALRIVNGRRQYGNPEQPGFSMKGRNIVTLLNQSDRWHAHISKTEYKTGNRWEGYEINDWDKSVGKDHHKIRYDIIQLLSSNELAQEGRELGHCVGSYTKSCFDGHCAIFSLKSEHNYKSKSLLTIEVRRKTIVQVRGKSNRKYTNNEMSLIHLWAKKEELSISKWV